MWIESKMLITTCHIFNGRYLSKNILLLFSKKIIKASKNNDKIVNIISKLNYFYFIIFHNKFDYIMSCSRKFDPKSCGISTLFDFFRKDIRTLRYILSLRSTQTIHPRVVTLVS